jgi:hypothetical protein
MPDVPQYLLDIRQLGTLIAGGLTVVGVLGSLVLMLAKRTVDLTIKLIGSFFVLGICFAAQDGIVYGIGVFVVATLVTELQFLEKLAALVWNRKEYWEYLSKASPAEVARRANAEIDENDPPQSSVGLLPTESGPADVPEKRPAISGLHYHRAVLRAFKSQSPFPIFHIQTDLKVHHSGREYFIDALIHTGITTYIVEIKASNSERRLREAVHQVRSHIERLGDLILENRPDAIQLRGIIVIPPSERVPLETFDIAILQFDPLKEVFTNGVAVREFLREDA